MDNNKQSCTWRYSHRGETYLHLHIGGGGEGKILYSKQEAVLMQFCTSFMSAIMKLTKHGAIIPTYTPCLVIANMVDMERVQKCISATRTLRKIGQVSNGPSE